MRFDDQMTSRQYREECRARDGAPNREHSKAEPATHGLDRADIERMQRRLRRLNIVANNRSGL